ncbi:MAG: hypothetical protein KKE17_13330 [Proteobacteria bacterium]|nr:hypothetical protein [Pseudomonadota bacterium]MBU1710978.1 hypothetical protein [Pseudomonadota bacterium]
MSKMLLRKLLYPVLAAGLLLSGASLTAAAELEFPFRVKYRDLSPIETEELALIYNDAIIVDSRDAREYKVIHMNGAGNIPVDRLREKDLLALREKKSSTPLVFYSNDTTCSNSYKAGARATEWGFANVRIYDAGIFYWVQNHPGKTDFFGRPMTRETLKTSLISKEDFNRKQLATEHFIDKANSGKYTIIDLREPNERSESPIRFPKMKQLTVDLLISLIEKQSIAVPRSGILILDNVGKQVEWVQYYFEKEGITDYYFLKKGVLQWKKDGYDPAGKKE